MAGYVVNIEKETLENENFRKVLFTAQNSQLVLMSLKPGEDIGAEIHDLDQFIRVDKGEGKALLDDEEFEVGDGWAIVVPAGVEHNLINTSDSEELKIYTVYSPPAHRDGVVHLTKADAESDTTDYYQG